MKRSVRLIALVFVLCMCVSLFSACGKDKEGTNSTSSTPASANLSTGDVTFVTSDGAAAYAHVIRPALEGAEYRDLVNAVIQTYTSVHGVAPKHKGDDTNGDGIAEIIIGETNRPETAQAKSVLAEKGKGRSHEYIICTINKSIVIYGMNFDATAAAVDDFINSYLVRSTIEGGINKVYMTDQYTVTDENGNTTVHTYQNITLLGQTNLSKVKIVRPIYNVSYLTQSETNKLVDFISGYTGYEIEVTHDQVASNEGNSLDGSGTLTKTEETEYEIIIGNCKRDGVKTITDKNAFEIRVEDKRIYLNGGSPYATAMAVTEFAAIVQNKKTVVKADAVANGDYKASLKKYDGKEYYRCTWKDDFEDTAINTKIWDVRWGERCYAATGESKPVFRGNKKEGNNYVKDGCLYIDALETDNGYYGGLLTTQGIMEYYMGYIEISTLHPRGDGFWSALYTMSAVQNDDKNNVGYKIDPERVYYNETDVEECYGAGDWIYGNTFAWPTAYGIDILTDANGKKPSALHVNNRLTSKDDRGFWMDFHTYGFELLDCTKISYTCDGDVWCVQELREGAEQHAYDQSVFIRLAMAPGTNGFAVTEDEESWKNYNSYIVDYVHVYQHAGDLIYTKKLSDLNWNKTVVE